MTDLHKGVMGVSVLIVAILVLVGYLTHGCLGG